MNKDNIKKIILKLLLLAAVLGLIGIYWYITPIPQYTATTLCSEEGEQVYVIIDVTWHRHLFAPTEIKGTVTVNGTVYSSISTAGYSFWDGIKEKFSSHSPNYLFASKLLYEKKADFPSADYLYLHLEEAGVDLEKTDSKGIHICILFRQAGSVLDYYGPARTAEEVEALLTKSAR